MKFIALICILLVAGCSIGSRPWAEYQNDKIGQKPSFLDPTRYGNAGDLIRADYLIKGDGFTHTSIDKDGNILQHWFHSEVLSSAPNKEWVGKCKVFYVVDPQSNLIVSWGYDKGANPESCRVWL